MFWQQAIYTQISSSPTIASAAPMHGYTHVPFSWRSGRMPAIRQTAQWWKPTRALSSQGSPPTSPTQAISPLVPPPHRILPLPSYPPLLSPRSLPSSPTFRSLFIFCSTAGQSSSVDKKIRPKYLNYDTAVSGFPYYDKTLRICSSVSATTNLCHFLYISCRHISEFGCSQLSSTCGKNMSHWGAPGVRLISLFQDYYAFPRVLVGKVYL